MNTDSKNSKELNTLLNGNLLAAQILCSSKTPSAPRNPSNSDLLCNILTQLHGARAKYPTYDRLISQVIFRIHDQACKTSKQFGLAAHLATISGFAQIPTKDITILKETLNRTMVIASFLCKSPKSIDSTALQDILSNLHDYRTVYPQFNRAISQRIFKLHDKAFYSPSKLMRQKAHIGTICGFEKNPTKDMAVLGELLKRVAMVEAPKNMASVFHSLLAKIVDTYVEQNYQQKDPNLKTAYQLKQFMYTLYPFAKTKGQQQLVHSCAVDLEKNIPSFKGLSKNFPVTVVKKNMHLDLKEPVNVFSPQP